MTLSLLCVREYGCISETHTEEEDRHREARGVGGGQGDNLVDLHLFTREREGEKHRGKPRLFPFQRGGSYLLD